ncbi:MAG TPA: methyl-accepting chemotaxis protein [Telluria sp.]|nr:methyl-accepting chemotaxis protein [Telluria sp.]
MLDQEVAVTPQPVPAAAALKLSGDMFGALINLAGRRRFTSQRVVLFAVLASMDHDGAIGTARDTLAQFRDAHLTLVEGKGGLPGIFCGQLRDAYFGTLQGDKIIRDFIALADAALDAIVADGRGAPALLDELVRSATPLLSVLNGLTLVYEEQSKRYAQAQRRQLQDMMGEIQTISKQARRVAFNAQVVAARAGAAGQEFAAVAGSMSNITGEIDDLVQEALSGALAY